MRSVLVRYAPARVVSVELPSPSGSPMSTARPIVPVKRRCNRGWEPRHRCRTKVTTRRVDEERIP
jgi:hypothetical protein